MLDERGLQTRVFASDTLASLTEQVNQFICGRTATINIGYFEDDGGGYFAMVTITDYVESEDVPLVMQPQQEPCGCERE